MAFWNHEKISYEKLNQMVDEAMDGSFSEESYTESELSKLESKWARFLAPRCPNQSCWRSRS